MLLTGYAKREIIIICFIGLILVAVSVRLILEAALKTGIICLMVSLFMTLVFLAFFRDPIRNIPKGKNLLVSPADGIINDIEMLEDTEENFFFKGNSTIRVGIFLSVFDVHINRAPCDIRVEKCTYKQGKYFDARNILASKENSSMTILGNASTNNKEFPIIIKQISGAIARRIVCQANRGTKLTTGQKFGMIKFGSRTELFLPAERFIQLEVQVGNKVYAGETIIARINNDK